MAKTTIKDLMKQVTVSNYAIKGDDSYGGAMMARSADAPGLVFIWPYALWGKDNNTPHFASRMSVKSYVPGDNTPGPYMDKPTHADIVTYDVEKGRITVPAGPVGIARAVARWIKENS